MIEKNINRKLQKFLCAVKMLARVIFLIFWIFWITKFIFTLWVFSVYAIFEHKFAFIYKLVDWKISHNTVFSKMTHDFNCCKNANQLKYISCLKKIPEKKKNHLFHIIFCQSFPFSYFLNFVSKLWIIHCFLSCSDFVGICTFLEIPFGSALVSEIQGCQFQN